MGGWVDGVDGMLELLHKVWRFLVRLARRAVRPRVGLAQSAVPDAVAMTGGRDTTGSSLQLV